MDTAKSLQASSARSQFIYDVFVSFIDKNFQGKFMDDLQEALMRSGIQLYRGDDAKRRKNPGLGIKEAVEKSKMSMVIFSKDYAPSRWCLDELVVIMECWKSVGIVVLPIYYCLDPSHARNLTGSFAQAFAKHNEFFKEDMDMVERWLAALREVSALEGLVLKRLPQEKFIQAIVAEVRKILKPARLHVLPNLVGMDSRVEEINLWLQNGSDDVDIAIICGIGGVGKTTIADVVFNENFHRFDCSSFLKNVREVSERPNGLVELQRQFLSDIQMEKLSKIHNADAGIMKIKCAMQNKKILIILDDVDRLEQFTAIIASERYIYPGSKIIITTRYEGLTKFFEDCKKFKVKALDDIESLQLFSWHAFRQSYPIIDYIEHSKAVVDHCEGLPFALKVWGYALYGRSKDLWESALRKHISIDNKTYQILRVSYDSLDDHDRSLFLEIACFFVGMDKDHVSCILEGCGYTSTFGIQELVDRCLITIDDNNKLMMHKLVRDMGRKIVREESPVDLGQCSRLWRHEDAFTVLMENSGTKTVIGLTLEQTNEVALKTMAFAKMRNLKLLRLNNLKLVGGYEDFPKSLVWLYWRGFPLKNIPNNMCLQNLVVLDLRNSNLKHVWKGTRFLGRLKIIDLSHSHSLVTTPDFSGLPNLEKLKLKGCINLVEVDESIGYLKKLVLLNLKDCKNLKKLPKNLAMVNSLRSLNLSGCLKLDGVLNELERMVPLMSLGPHGNQINQTMQLMRGGMGLTEPPKVEEWERSEEIYLMDNELSSLPMDVRCPELKALFLERNHRLRMIPPLFFYQMPNLQVLNLSKTRIRLLPESLFWLVNLKRLFLNYCDNLLKLPPQIGELEHLEVLDLEGTEMVDLPKELEKLTNLTCLEVSFCEPIDYSISEKSGGMIPLGVISTPSMLEELNIDVSPDDKRWNSCVGDVVFAICGLNTLITLKIYIPEVQLLSHFIISSLSHFRFIVGHHGKRILYRIPRYVELELEQYDRCLKYINGGGTVIPTDIIEVLKHATAFFLDRHTTVRTLSEFGHENMKQLKCCVVGECNELLAIIDGDKIHKRKYGDIGFGLESLEYLYICYVKNLRSIWEGPMNRSGLFSLKFLTLRMCRELTTIFTPGLLDTLPRLEELTVDGCPKLTSLVSFSDSNNRSLPALKKLTLHSLLELDTIFASGLLVNLPYLEELTIDDCPKITSIESCNGLPENLPRIGLASSSASDDKITCAFPALKKMSLHFLPKLAVISSGLPISPGLELMSFYYCPNLNSLPISKGFNQNLKSIKGELSWWQSLNWERIQQGSWDDIFVPIK